MGPKGQGNPSTLGVPSFWSNALIPLADQGPYPYLVWSSYPDENVWCYKIYKKKDSPNFEFIALTTNLYFEDSSELLYLIGMENKDKIHYYVKAVYGQPAIESEASNTVVATIGDLPSASKSLAGSKINNNKEQIEKGVILFSAYPNPFNPTTKISFSIAATDFVTLKIFDSLGRQVAELVNEIKEAGIYDAEFNGSSLSSGIYYYTLTTSNYTQTRKMLLVK